MEQKIRAIMIIEVAGRPPEYLVESIKAHIDKLNSFQGAKVVRSRFAEPRKLSEEKDLYTTFSEVEIETISMQKLLDVVFEFMPSSIEILDPEEVVFSLQETTNFLNDLSARLHKYDDVAKIARFQIQDLTQKLQQFQQAPKQNVSLPIQPIKVTIGDQAKPNPEKKTEKKTKKTKSKKK
jgi:chromosome condensin MukBEF ATPase and DNA-binding subunit MukB